MVSTVVTSIILLGVLGILVKIFYDNRNLIRYLKLERSKFQSAIDSINIGFIITNNFGEIETINMAAKSILCVGKSHTNYTRVDKDLIRLECSIEQIANNLGNSFDIKNYIQRCIQDKKPIHISNLPFKNLFLHIHMTPMVYLKKEKSIDLDFIGVVILIEDVTEEHILDRSRADFFSIASHELKTPLTIIKGNAEIIKHSFSQTLSPAINKMIDDIKDSSEQLIAIVSDFLDISRLEQGKIEYKKQSFDIGVLIEEVISNFQEMAIAKNIYLKFDKIPNSTTFVSADINRTKQILINLIGNSVKFTETGGITLKLDGDSAFVKIIVTDTGIGISGENQKLVFRKFQLAREDQLSRDTARSTGVGLYISKVMVEGMGGQIKLEHSQLGLGSTFSFTLPKVGI